MNENKKIADHVEQSLTMVADHSGDANEMVYSKPSVFDGVCCGCSKKAADGYALYCVECWEKSNGDPFANAGKPIDHIPDATKMVAEPVKHSEHYWLHEINNARADGYERGYMAAKKLYAEPVKQEPVAWTNYNGAVNNRLKAAPVQPVQEPVAVVKESLTTELLVDALTSILKMNVKGYELQERLQFSTIGRQLLEKANNALSAPVDAKAIRAEALEEAAKVAAGYDASPWKHCQTSAHAADIVSASIAAAIRGLK